MADKIVEVSLIFRGKDAEANAEAFMLHLDTVDGIGHLIEGVTYFGGNLNYIKDDPEQRIVFLDGDMEDGE